MVETIGWIRPDMRHMEIIVDLTHFEHRVLTNTMNERKHSYARNWMNRFIVPRSN